MSTDDIISLIVMLANISAFSFLFNHIEFNFNSIISKLRLVTYNETILNTY